MKFTTSIIMFCLLTSNFADEFKGLKISLKKPAKVSLEKRNANLKLIKSICGCEPKIEADWKSLITLFKETSYQKGIFSTINNNCLHTLHLALKKSKICPDYKKEFCSGVKKVLFKKDKSSTVKLSKGILTIGYDGGSSCAGSSSMQKVIEEAL